MQTAQRTRILSDADVADMLTIDQQRALSGLLSQLDRTHGVPGPHMFTLFGARKDIEEVLRVSAPDGPRKPRTPDHRKVLAAYVDAANLPPYLRPWQFLVFELLEALSESALPSEKPDVSALRSELLKLTRLQEEADRAPSNESASAAVAQATTAFVKRFRSALPAMILNVVSLANAVLLFVVDNAHQASSNDAAQLLEASRYFLSAPSCAVLMCGDESLFIERLSRSGTGTDGRSLLRGWQTGRIDVGDVVVQPAFRGQPAPSVLDRAPSQPTPKAAPRGERRAAAAPSLATAPWIPLAIAGGVFAIDQLSKIGATPIARTGLTGGLAMGVELLGVALAALMWMWAPETDLLRRSGYALIAGGLASSLLDGVLRGATMVVIRIGALPGFSLAHIAMLGGIALIGFGLLKSEPPKSTPLK